MLDCPSGYWECDDGYCVRDRDRCDGHEECPDGSDEDGCGKSSVQLYNCLGPESPKGHIQYLHLNIDDIGHAIHLYSKHLVRTCESHPVGECHTPWLPKSFTSLQSLLMIQRLLEHNQHLVGNQQVFFKKRSYCSPHSRSKFKIMLVAYAET